MARETEDTRWRFLAEGKWQCDRCDEWHDGLPDLGSDAPEHWGGDPTPGENSLALESTHFLSEDFCVIEDRDFFVRCVLQIPLIGSGGDKFGYGVWSTLSRQNFEIYRESFDKPMRGNLGPWFGWFSNRLKGYPDTVNLKCRVHPRPNRQRPLIELEPTDHPLAVESRDGITYERLIEIYTLHGHPPRVS